MPRPYPKHKCNGLPGLVFLYKAFKRHLNKRITLRVNPRAYVCQHLIELGFDPNKPVLLTGIFRGFRKAMPYPHGWHNPAPVEIFLCFDSVAYIQEEKKAIEFWDVSPSRKKARTSSRFLARDFLGLDWMKENKVPLLEYTKLGTTTDAHDADDVGVLDRG